MIDTDNHFREYRHLAHFNKGTFLGLTAVLLWASAAALVAAADGVHPFLYYGIEMVIGFLIFMVYWAKCRHDPRPEWKKVPYWYIALGIIGIGFQGACWVAAIQHAPPLEALLFIYQWPMLVVIFTAIALKNPLKPHHFIALAGGFLGVLIVLIGRGLDLGSFSLTSGHIFGLLSALTWSVFSAISARHPLIPSSALGLILLVGGMINLLIWVVGFGAPLPPVNGFLICLVASLVIMPGYILWDYGMKNGNQRLMGFASFSIPVLSALLLAITGQDQFSWYTLLGLTIVMTALAIAKFYPQKTKP